MSISGISSNVTTTSVKFEAEYTKVSAKTGTADAAKKAAENDTVAKTDGFEKSPAKEEIGYSNIGKGLSAEEIKELDDARLNGLKEMVQKLISSQANKAGNADFSFVNAKISIDISISAESVQNVENDIFNDPNFGVDAMATNLMNMAISLSGGDSSKADLLLNAVQKGFDDATAAWGDKLPDVSRATRAEVEKRFDYWKENGSMDGYTYTGYTIPED